MSLKRRLERDSEQNFPAKRYRCSGNLPQTPTQDSLSISSSISNSRAGTIPFMPATPYTPYPLQPSDSPTNPFKGKRKVDTLPPVSSFGKHIALRFQFHRRSVGFRKGGVHRIVQVPLNYTFTHLRALIAWLFDTPTTRPNRKAGEEGYIFEVKTNIAMESPLMKPGMIKSGVTSVKVSNVKDPWRKRYGQSIDDEDELDEESEADAEEEVCETPYDESDDWVWADEDDHTLAHVWITGVQADRGIIYHHSSNIQIHITANATKLPRRRGKSNVPYVFFAQGRVHLSPLPLPRPVFTQSILHTLSSSPAGPSISDYGKSARSAQSGSPKRKSRSLPSDRSPEGAELTDTDADGDPDSDTENMERFDDSHPFFCSPDTDEQDVQISPPKKVAQVGVRGDKGRNNHSPEVIYVEDSDDENELHDPEEEEESEDETIEVYDRLINPDHWNESQYAYGRYLLSFLDGRGRSFDHIDDEYFEELTPYDPFDNDDDVKEEDYVEDDSMWYPIEIEDEVEEFGPRSRTPELTSSSTRQMSSLPSSSPPTQTPSSPEWHHQLCSERSDDLFTLTSSVDPLSLSPDSSLELHPSIIALHYPNKKYMITPAPPKTRKHRLRLERLEKRLEKFKKGKYLCAYDEKPKEEEVDELFDDEDEDEGDEDDPQAERYVGPSLQEREAWDPFGDEIEI